MRQVTAFQASDGTIFTNEQEAALHEAMAAREKDLAEYFTAMQDAGIQGAALSRRVSGARAYLEFAETGKIQPVQSHKTEAS